MKITVPNILELKSKRVISMMTAFDYPSSKAISEEEIDIILVGDSLAQVVLGYEDTLSITVDEMMHHVKAVTRAKPNCLVIADMPYMSYHISVEDTLANAGRFIKEGKVDAVKIEGGSSRTSMIEALVSSEIPVMGHLGLTPQSKNIMGGYKVQGKSLEVAEKMLKDALAIEEAGCFSIVLEGVPSVVADVITQSLRVPTIGIGAGGNVDGQVLVLNDLLGMKSKEYIDAKFVKRYSNQYQDTIGALKRFKEDVENRKFPEEKHSYKAGEDIEEKLNNWKKDLIKINLS